DKDNVFLIALADGVRDDGQAVHIDNREQAKQVFTSLSEMKGFFMHLGRSGLKGYVSEPVWGRLPDGQVTLLSSSGLSSTHANGGFSFDDTTPVCKTPILDGRCTPNVCGPPNICNGPVADPATGKDKCTCSFAGGTCDVIYVLMCPKPALCANPDTCELDPQT